MLLTRIMPEFQELNWRQFSREESKKIIANLSDDEATSSSSNLVLKTELTMVRNPLDRVKRLYSS